MPDSDALHAADALIREDPATGRAWVAQEMWTLVWDGARWRRGEPPDRHAFAPVTDAARAAALLAAARQALRQNPGLSGVGECGC